MFRKWYSIVLLVAGLGIVAFKLQSSVKEHTDKTVICEPAEPEYNPVIEIQSTITQFDSLLEANLRETGTVGAAAVVIYKGRIALIKSFGVRKAGTSDPVNEHTLFRLASVSKPITGVLAGILDDENIVKLNDKVVDYLPGFSLKDRKSTEELTIQNLLSHTSGLIPHAYDMMVEDHVPLEQIMERIPEAELTAAPGQTYSYQNVMYSVYGPVLTARTHKSFEKLIQEKLFDPLKMTDACIGYEAFEKNDNKAYPHYNQGNKHFSPMRLNDRYYNTAPAAGINASISDLAQLMINLTDRNSKAISENAKEKVLTPVVNSPLSRAYFRSWGKGVQSKQYAIGWRIVDYKGHRIAYHGGFVSGYKAEIAICEDEEIGIALLTNSPSSETAQNIPTFLNLLFQNQERLAMQNQAANPDDDKS